ncbi:MAG: hypothetical protein WC815_06135 [Vicinamibacterales bacterium]|jgi:hypothetical protein
MPRSPDGRLLLATLLIVLTLAGPAAPQTRGGSTQSPARVFDVTAARGVTSGKPVGPTEVFAPAGDPVYVWFRHENVPAGATITARWYYLGVAPPFPIGEGTITTQPTHDWGQFSLELAQGKVWPPGSYRVDLLIAGTLAAEARFTVEPPPAASRPAVTPPVASTPPDKPTAATPAPPPAPAGKPALPAGTAAQSPGGTQAPSTTVPQAQLPSGAVGVPTAKFTDDSVCDQSRWPTKDVPWQSQPGSPTPAAKADTAAASVAPPLDFGTVTSVQYGGAVSAAMESMRLVYGPLSPEDTARFEKKWAPLLDFPTIEIVTYLNRLNPLLGQFLVARSGYAAAANGLFVALHDGGLAMANGSEEGANDAWLQARAYRELMASYEARLKELVAAIEALGNPPSPYDLKCRAGKRAKEALSIFEAQGSATFHLYVEDEAMSMALAPQICGFVGTRPLVGATVVLEGPTSARGVADSTGTLTLSALMPGLYRVRIHDPDGRDLDTVAREFRAAHRQGTRMLMDQVLFCGDSLSAAGTPAATGLDAFTLDAKTTNVEWRISYGSNLFGIDTWAGRGNFIAGLQGRIDKIDAQLKSGKDENGAEISPAMRERLRLQRQAISIELGYERGLIGRNVPSRNTATRGPGPSISKPTPPAAPIVNEDAARQQYIQAITRRVSEYDKQLATETDSKRRSDLEYLKLIAVSEIQLEQARLQPASDGQPAFIRTALGDYVRGMEYQKSVEEAARSRAMGRIWTAIDKQIAILPDNLGENWRMSVNEQANRRGTSVDDMAKAEQALLSVSNSVQSYWSREAGRNLEKAAYYDWVENTPKTISKVAIGVALVGLSAPAAVAMLGESALVMSWAPKAAGFVYGGVTGYREGGPVEGVKGALTWMSGVSFVAVEAFNGYEQEMAQSGDWRAAATAGASRGAEAYVGGKLIEKTFQFGAALFGPAAPSAAPRLNVARYQQELRGAEQKIASFKRVSDELSGAQAAGAPSERILALKQVQQEAAADINASYQAKLRLKYVDKETGRAYSQVMTTVYDDMSDPLLKALEQKGYDVANIRLKAIRNASSEGSVGMDFDLMLEQQPGLIIRKNGERVSALTFEKDAQAVLNDVYYKRMARNPEMSFLNLTTSSHPEAYADLAWLGDKVTKKINFEGIDPSAAQAGEVAAFKARHAINTTSLSEVSKVQEATRGLGKDVNTKVVPYIDYKLKAAEAAGDAAGASRLRALRTQWTTIGADYEAIGTTVGDAGSILARLRDLEARGLGVAKVINTISSHMEMLSKFY